MSLSLLRKPYRGYPRMPKLLPLLDRHSLYSLSFAGTNGLVSVNRTSSLDIGTSDLSILMWLKATAPLAQEGGLLIKRDWGSGTNPGYQLQVEPNGVENFFFCDGSATRLVGASTINVCDGKWHYLALICVRTASATFYVDVIPRGTLNISAQQGSLANSANLHVGADCNGDEFLNGIIGEPQLYNRALSQPEIQRNMSNPSNPITNGLVLFLPIIEGTGTIVNDYSGLNNNGSITGTVAWYEMALNEPQADIL